MAKAQKPVPSEAEPVRPDREFFGEIYSQAWDFDTTITELNGLRRTLHLVGETVDVESEPDLAESLGWLTSRLADIEDQLSARRDELTKALHPLAYPKEREP